VRRAIAAVICAVTLSACDSSRPKKPHVPAQIEKKAAAMQSLGDPVNFEALQAFLPSNDFIVKDGWQKSDMTGMLLSVPMKGSQASLTLKKSGAQMVVNITDTVFNQSLYAPVAAFLADGFSTSDADGYKKSVTMQGFPAFEERSIPKRAAGVTVLVGRRFLVHVQGTGVDGTDAVKTIAGQINMARLAELK